MTPTIPSPISDKAAGELPDFNDVRVQIVYEMLCEPANPPTGDHWEGFIARKIVAAFSTAPTTGSAPAVYLRQSSEYGPWLETGKDDPFAVAFVPASPAASALSDDAILAIAIDHGLGTAVVESIAKALLAASTSSRPVASVLTDEQINVIYACARDQSLTGFRLAVRALLAASMGGGRT